MEKVRIYLRSVSLKKETRLMLFDSNREGDINNLITTVTSGATIVWKRDRCSGIKKILRIYSKTGKGIIFLKEPRKRLFCMSFVLKAPIVDKTEEEAYAIEYLRRDNERVTIDPVIKITPP